MATEGVRRVQVWTHRGGEVGTGMDTHIEGEVGTGMDT